MRKGSIQHYAEVTLQHLAHPTGEPMPRSASQASRAGETATQTNNSSGNPSAGKQSASNGLQMPELPSRAPRRRQSRTTTSAQASTGTTRRRRLSQDNSDVLVSAVISTYLLTHLHHVLQRAEFSAVQDGRSSQAANYAQLRKVLCMDARSMEDASATGLREADLDLAA